MPDWSAIHRENAARARQKEIPRALDVETGRPIPLPKISIKHRIQLTMLSKFLPLINSWLARRILAALTAGAAVLGVSDSDTKGAAAFASAACVFAFDCLQSWIRRKWMKPKPLTEAPRP